MQRKNVTWIGGPGGWVLRSIRRTAKHPRGRLLGAIYQIDTDWAAFQRGTLLGRGTRAECQARVEGAAGVLP